MKGSLLWRLMYLLCALAGVLAGYGIVAVTGRTGAEPEKITKDNTLVREAGDSVFFAEEGNAGNQEPAVTQQPAKTELSPVTPAPDIPAPAEQPAPTQIPLALPSVTPAAVTQTPLRPSPTGTPAPAEVSEDKLPSLGVQWAGTMENVPEISLPSVPSPAPEAPATQAITYPAKIFGQTPVLNRSDAYVSYFEFAYDLIAMMEPVVSARGLNMNSLLTKFVIKALFCGVDIEKLDINAPIPRRLAALCLWLAAQVLNEEGCETSAKSAGAYVTDISGCSASEKKAVAYLYESGILKGYQVSGQRFCPEDGLQTAEGNNWLLAVKQLWK